MNEHTQVSPGEQEHPDKQATRRKRQEHERPREQVKRQDPVLPHTERECRDPDEDAPERSDEGESAATPRGE